MKRSLLIVAILITPAFVAQPGFAQKPEIKSMSVLGIPAGKASAVIVYGENLAPASVASKTPLVVRLLEAKPTDEKSKGKGSRQVTLEVTVPTGCPRETFELVLTNPDKSEVKTNLCVTDMVSTEVEIKKPSSTFATAMRLPGPSAAVVGQLDGDSADLVRIDARAGEIWDISLLCGRGGSQLDPVLRVRDSHHMSIALSAGDKKNDRRIQFHVKADGPYYVEITEAEARGGAGFNYRLSINRRQ